MIYLTKPVLTDNVQINRFHPFLPCEPGVAGCILNTTGVASLSMSAQPGLSGCWQSMVTARALLGLVFSLLLAPEARGMSLQ